MPPTFEEILFQDAEVAMSQRPGTIKYSYMDQSMEEQFRRFLVKYYDKKYEEKFKNGSIRVDEGQMINHIKNKKLWYVLKFREFLAFPIEKIGNVFRYFQYKLQPPYEMYDQVYEDSPEEKARKEKIKNKGKCVIDCSLWIYENGTYEAVDGSQEIYKEGVGGLDDAFREFKLAMYEKEKE